MRPVISSILIVTLAVLLGACASQMKASSVDNGDRIKISQPQHGQQVAVFAGGCFWSMQAMFSQLKGVEEAVPGYAGGHTASPSYEDVCSHTTGYAESVRVVFDPKVISYRQLLTIFFSDHDPTTLYRQGDDEGTNYRSAIFYRTAAQKADAADAVADTNKKLGGDVVVTQVVPYTNFYPAELYHNHYFARHPDESYCAYVVAPKVAKFQSHWKAWLK